MNSIGLFKTVERRQNPGKKPYFYVEVIDDQTNMLSKFNYFKAEVQNVVGKRCSYTTEQNGQYKNLVSFEVLPESQQPKAAGVQQGSTGGSTNQLVAGTESPDARQENINRQSAINAAVQLVSAQITAGLSPLGTKVVGKKATEAAEKAAIDPLVAVEMVKQTAKVIKHFVQKGDWTFSNLKEDVAKSEAEEAGLTAEMPF